MIDFQSDSGMRVFRACFENRSKPKIKHIFLDADHRSAEKRKGEYDREKNMFLKILAQKHRFGKYKRNDEMINPNETKAIHTEKNIMQLQFLAIVHIPLKTPSATCKGKCECFYLWQSSAKRNQILIVHIPSVVVE